MLAERKAFQEHGGLIHEDAASSECSSPSVASMLTQWARERWMKATCSIFKGQIVFR